MSKFLVTESHKLCLFVGVSPYLIVCFRRTIRFTYLAKDDRDRCLSVIQELKSEYRWLLSGTPQHRQFNDISSLATLLGIHLGVDEDLPFTKLSKKFLSGKTGLENLSSFMECRSIQVR
jgi:hypothetical protein